MASSAEVVSGEIYFRSKSAGFQLGLDEKLKSLDNFLEYDASSNLQKSQSRVVLDRLQSIRHLNSTAYDLSVTHDSIILQQFFDSTCNCALNDAAYSREKTSEEIRQLQQSTDAKLMEHALDYFSIVKEEMNSTRERLDRSLIECSHKKQQAKRLRDVQIFSRHLHIETQGSVSFDAITEDGSQWKRCVKAVKDNLQMSTLRSAGFMDVTVLNAFKLEHKLLTKHMKHAARQSPDTVKVKGLFVSLPKNEIYGFSAFGLHCQNNGYSANLPLDGSDPSVLPGLFQLPWFCAELSGSAEPIRVGDKAASKESKRSEPSAGHSSSTSDGRKGKPQGTAEILARSNTSLQLRFSKFSNPHNLCFWNKESHQRDNDEGSFVALCRVLLMRIQSVEGEITLADMETAVASGHDAVFSRSRGEYALLCPQYVLPEFLMHVQLTGHSEDAVSADSPEPSLAPSLALPPGPKSAFSSSSSSRRNSYSKISVPSYLCVGAKHCNSEGLGGGHSTHTEPDSREDCIVLSDSDQVGRLLMRNKVSSMDSESSNSRFLSPASRGGNVQSEATLKGMSELCVTVRPSKSDADQSDALSGHSAAQSKQSILARVQNTPADFNVKKKKIFFKNYQRHCFS